MRPPQAAAPFNLAEVAHHAGVGLHHGIYLRVAGTAHQPHIEGTRENPAQFAFEITPKYSLKV